MYFEPNHAEGRHARICNKPPIPHLATYTQSLALARLLVLSKRVTEALEKGGGPDPLNPPLYLALGRVCV